MRPFAILVACTALAGCELDAPSLAGPGDTELTVRYSGNGGTRTIGSNVEGASLARLGCPDGSASGTYIVSGVGSNSRLTIVAENPNGVSQISVRLGQGGTFGFPNVTGARTTSGVIAELGRSGNTGSATRSPSRVTATTATVDLPGTRTRETLQLRYTGSSPDTQITARARSAAGGGSARINAAVAEPSLLCR